VSDDDGVVLATLAGLATMYPRRLRHVLLHHEASEAFDHLVAGRRLHPMVMRSFRKPGAFAELCGQARAADVGAMAARCRSSGVRVISRHSSDFPAQLTVDPDPPAVLFARGDIDALDARRVGIIGTRNCTAAGRATAAELGHSLADLGVSVVSGLALGIDGAAHGGACSAKAGQPVAVVGNGIDIPYPKRNASLWERVAERGVILSEWPPGVGPEAWRFPLRNRILAALCEVLVVVESRERGGSLITAREALERSVEVMAVPGSPHSAASVGANKLLVDGAAPVTEVGDVLAMLGLDHRRQFDTPFDPRPPLDDAQSEVLAACVECPCTLDMLVMATRCTVAEAAMAATRLVDAGRLHEAGGWFEFAGSRLGEP